MGYREVELGKGLIECAGSYCNSERRASRGGESNACGTR